MKHIKIVLACALISSLILSLAGCKLPGGFTPVNLDDSAEQADESPPEESGGPSDVPVEEGAVPIGYRWAECSDETNEYPEGFGFLKDEKPAGIDYEIYQYIAEESDLDWYIAWAEPVYEDGAAAKDENAAGWRVYSLLNDGANTVVLRDAGAAELGTLPVGYKKTEDYKTIPAMLGFSLFSKNEGQATHYVAYADTYDAKGVLTVSGWKEVVIRKEKIDAIDLEGLLSGQMILAEKGDGYVAELFEFGRDDLAGLIGEDPEYDDMYILSVGLPGVTPEATDDRRSSDKDGEKEEKTDQKNGQDKSSEAEKTKKEPKKGDSSSSSSNSGSSYKPSKSDKSDSSSGSNKEDKSSSGSDSSGSAPAPAPKPSGHWEKVWVVDREAWEEEVKETKLVGYYVCNWPGCGFETTSDSKMGEHQKQHMMAGEGAGWHTEDREEVVGTKTVHHDEEGHWTEVWMDD